MTKESCLEAFQNWRHTSPSLWSVENIFQFESDPIYPDCKYIHKEKLQLDSLKSYFMPCAKNSYKDLFTFSLYSWFNNQ